MSSAIQQTDVPNPQLIWDTMNAYQRTSALRSAIELDVFTALSEGTNTVEALAKRCQASARGVRVLCDYLAVLGLLFKDAGVYSLTATSAVFLNRHSPAAMNSMVQFLNAPWLMEGFQNLTETVRKGGTQLVDGGCNQAEYSGWVTFAQSMMPLMQGAAEFIACQVASESIRAAPRILDVAAGHGLFGITVARRIPQAEITAQDWAKVLSAAKDNASASGVSDRYHEIPGDVFQVDLGGPYDVALLTNLLHHFDRAGCVALLRKLHSVLTPQGRLMILEFVPNEDRVTPPIPASFSMMMLGLTAAGDVYTAAEHAAMLQEAGFSATRFTPIPQSPQHLIVSKRTTD